MSYDYKKLQSAIADIEKQIEVLYVAGEIDEYKERALELTRDLTKTLANLEFFRNDVTDISDAKTEKSESGEIEIARVIRKDDKSVKKLALSYLAKEKITRGSDALNSLFSVDFVVPSQEPELPQVTTSVSAKNVSDELDKPVMPDTDVSKSVLPELDGTQDTYVDFLNASSMVNPGQASILESDSKIRITRLEPPLRALSFKKGQRENLDIHRYNNPKVMAAFNYLKNVSGDEQLHLENDEMHNLGIEPIPPKLTDEEALEQALTIHREVIGVSKPKGESTDIAINELSQLIMAETSDTFDDETPLAIQH